MRSDCSVPERSRGNSLVSQNRGTLPKQRNAVSKLNLTVCDTNDGYHEYTENTFEYTKLIVNFVSQNK